MGDIPASQRPGPIHRELADTVVRVVRESTGRGPTRARAIVNDDIVMVVLYDTLTKGERTLVEHGAEADALAYRRAFQGAMAAEVVAAVEQVVGRTVVAFMSADHVDPDCSCEIFVLGDALPGVAGTAAPRRPVSAPGPADSSSPSPRGRR